jgi:predicted GH43/DUF377 family glycosyl hydrolase
MIKKKFTFFIGMIIPLIVVCANPQNTNLDNRAIVASVKRIYLQEFPEAHNPSLIKIDEGHLLTFRYCPDRFGHISHIGIVLLDDNFTPISKPQLLDTRLKNSRTPSQSEDARIFVYRGRTFLIYNDNIEIISPNYNQRRDMFIAELFRTGNGYSLSTPMKLTHNEKYQFVLWQKNWTPFEWNNTLLLSYTFNPHEVLYVNLFDGSCYPNYLTSPSIDWPWGQMRGGTPPVMLDGEFFAFFHSSISTGNWQWQYYMGAYTFSAEPPFKITRISKEPIVAKEFYISSNYYKKVVFPGGVVVSGDRIYVAYGKDDSEMWIATIDKEALMDSLTPVE